MSSSAASPNTTVISMDGSGTAENTALRVSADTARSASPSPGGGGGTLDSNAHEMSVLSSSSSTTTATVVFPQIPPPPSSAQLTTPPAASSAAAEGSTTATPAAASASSYVGGFFRRWGGGGSGGATATSTPASTPSLTPSSAQSASKTMVPELTVIREASPTPSSQKGIGGQETNQESDSSSIGSKVSKARAAANSGPPTAAAASRRGNKKSSSHHQRPPCQTHSFHTDHLQVQHMEQGLIKLMEDFNSGKLRAFGQGCSMEQMQQIRDQQESLARLHFELGARQEARDPFSDDGLLRANESMDKLMEQLERLSMAIGQLNPSAAAASMPSQQGNSVF